MKRILTVILSAVMLFSTFGVSAADETLSDDIVILYTNDVHTYIDGNLSYDVISAIKQDLKTRYKNVLLADAGDHIQGTAYGSIDKGESIIKIMNASKYDVATLGNHEFDYDMDGCLKAIEMADFPYVSANFYHEKGGKRTENVLEGFKLFDCGNEKIAFVGITTPETFEKSTSAYFKNENGEFVYGISGGKDGSALQSDVQDEIIAAKESGATRVIALGHLGDDPSSSPWTSEETIAALSGLDAFIDGHSHNTVKGKSVKDKDGNDVLLTQTGSYFDRIGIMVIDDETGEITTDFIEYEELFDEDGELLGARLASDLYENDEVLSDSEVKVLLFDLIEEVDSKLGENIGSAKVTLDNYDAGGSRLVRKQETNTGDFAADALYYLFDSMGMEVDAAIMNGGGIRNTALSGDISYKDCKAIHTFGNVACLQKVTGMQLLDALEWGARLIGTGENGGFLQVSGITYKVDTEIPNTVKEDEIGTWVEGADKYRVHDVLVYNKATDAYEPLDTGATYNLAGYNYTLRNLGDGYAMFDGAVNVLDYVAEDYMVLAEYIKGFDGGVIGAQNSPLKEKYPAMLLDYQSVNGSGRIEITKSSENKDIFDVFEKFDDVENEEWFADGVAYVTKNNLMNGISKKEFAPNDAMTRAMLVTVLYRAEGEPSVSSGVSFADVNTESYYSDAVAWAEQNGIVSGVGEDKFAPDECITREDIATIIYRYAKYKEINPQGAWAIRLDYGDLAEISDYAVESVMYCKLKGILSGNENGLFGAKAFATRAEVATVLLRFAENASRD